MLYRYSQACARSLYFHHNLSERSHVNDYNCQKPGNRSLHKLRYHIVATVQHRRTREEPQKPDAYVHRGTTETCAFRDAKIPKFTYVKFEKKTDIKLRNGRPQGRPHFRTI